MELQRITKHTRPANRVEKWHVVDADGERLGRLATKVANLLQGKHRPDYSKHQLNEDFVIVVNAAKVGASGNKMAQKVYYRHSGYLGGLRSRTLEEMLTRFPERVIELAVKGMLPRNRLGRRMLRRLKVYAGPTHPHEAQVRLGMGKARPAPAVVVASASPAEEAVDEAAVASAVADDQPEEATAAATEEQTDDTAAATAAAPDASADEAPADAAEAAESEADGQPEPEGETTK